MILNVIVVVSFARKSGVRQIISIEDLWGDISIGFLIGFLDQSFTVNHLMPESTTGGQ
jgi:hypothetical protein